MEHPLINNIDDLTLEELNSKISDLTKKMNWARRHNHHLASQISMALETYQNKYHEKQRKLWDQNNQRGNDYSDRIDIS
jgi:hypothetical protein